MTMNQRLNYDEVEGFLKTYTTDPGPYDFNGLLHLILAAVDSIREHALDQDFEDFAHTISDEQALFLRKLLDNRGKNLGDAEKNE
jgi:hypothetical protein